MTGLVITRADRQKAWPFRQSCYTEQALPFWLDGEYDICAPVIQAFARHRISHSLPGDVGLREALRKARWHLYSNDSAEDVAQIDKVIKYLRGQDVTSKPQSALNGDVETEGLRRWPRANGAGIEQHREGLRCAFRDGALFFAAYFAKIAGPTALTPSALSGDVGTAASQASGAVWRDMSEAPRDRTRILAITGELADERWSHLSHREFVVFHLGTTDRMGVDMGWSLFPGMGVSDEWLAGWLPLPAA